MADVPEVRSGCCTSTSTSSSRRSRCCAGPSWPAGRWWSAAAATRPSAASSPPRRTPPASTASGPGCRCAIAARKLPDAVFLPVDKPAYDEASARVMDTLRSLEWGGVPVVVEVLGWDEAFLGPGPGHGELGDPRGFAQHIRETVHEATDLTCGVGIGDNKLRAKIATAFGKTGEGDGSGIGYLTAAEWYDVMGDRPTTALWGIGSKIGKRLAALGHPHRARARRVRRPDAGRRDRADDGAVVPPARPRRRHQPGRRDAVDAAGARARGDLPDRPDLGRRTRRAPGADRAGRGGHRPRGTAGGAGRDQGAVPAVHHRQPVADAARSVATTWRCWPMPRSPCSTGSSTTGRCACSAYAWRWWSPREATCGERGRDWHEPGTTSTTTRRRRSRGGWPTYADCSPPTSTPAPLPASAPCGC